MCHGLIRLIHFSLEGPLRMHGGSDVDVTSHFKDGVIDLIAGTIGERFFDLLFTAPFVDAV